MFKSHRKKNMYFPIFMASSNWESAFIFCSSPMVCPDSATACGLWVCPEAPAPMVKYLQVLIPFGRILVYTRFEVLDELFKVELTYISGTQFQHTHFKCSFNTHISNTVSTQTFEVQFQHIHFKCSFNTHISSTVSTHTFQVQFQHTYFKYSFNTHISSTVSTHIFQVQFQHTYFSTHTHTKVQNACQALSPWHHKFST